MQYYGENGLIKKAKEKKSSYGESVKSKEEEINELKKQYEIMMDTDNIPEAPPDPSTPEEPEIPKGPNGKQLVNKDTVTTTNHEKIIGEDTLGNQVVVPKGFKVAEESGTTVKEGMVLEDEIGNQFVWIPISNINGDGSNKIKVNSISEEGVEITLGRYTFARVKNETTGLYEDGTPTKVQYGSEYAATTVEEVKAGRVTQYKAGDCYYELADARISNNQEDTTGTNTTAKNLKGFIESVRDNHGYYLGRYESSRSEVNSNRPASKIAKVWGSTTQSEAATACRNMYVGNTKVGVESDLCNSYAWDTAIVYIQAMGHSNYANADSATIGNSSPKETGKTGDEKCKIFDMAANYFEWVTEYSTIADTTNAAPCGIRGGVYHEGDFYASCRSREYATSNYDTYTFRLLLYI